MQFNPYIRKVAVLGAGILGTQIAALFVNSGIEVILFDLSSKEGDPNALVKDAIHALRTLEPSPLAVESWAANIMPANYEHDLVLLKNCNLIIEAISERIDWKKDLFRKISPFISSTTFLVSNTSGLSIEKLASDLPEEIKPQFCGIHFFNPPRFIHLVELIPHSGSNPLFLEKLETFLVSELGKGVIYAKDTPKFIGNRIGTFALLATIHHAEHFGLTPDCVDLITGNIIGRPESATFGTIDTMGIDVFNHIVNTMHEELPEDPWRSHFKLPSWFSSLLQKGNLGSKTNIGIYRKLNKEVLVFDKMGNYRPQHFKVNPEISQLLQIEDAAERFTKLRNSSLVEANFLWSIFRDLFHYCAFHLSAIAETASDIDLCMRWGFGFLQGPFELWQSIGWKTVISWIEEDIRAKRSLSKVPLPSWIYGLEFGVYRNNTAFSARRGIFLGQAKLPVYKRQLYPDQISYEQEVGIGSTLFETNAIRMWSTQDDVGILNFKTKENIITVEVLEGILEAIHKAEQSLRALVLWQKIGRDWSRGLNLKIIYENIIKGQFSQISKLLKLFQQTTQALRYTYIPTIAVIRGRALGGACELMMHCSRTVAALESYPGLTETNWGVIPAGGGSKEMTRRSNVEHLKIDPLDILQHYFQMMLKGLPAASAQDAKKLGLLRDSDTVVINPHETLYIAKQIAVHLSETNYRPPLKQRIHVVGKSGCAALQVGLINLRESGQLTDHDYFIGSGLAHVLCGGEVEGGSEVPEEWLLELERQFFMELIQTKKTQERIQYMVEHGKSIRN